MNKLLKKSRNFIVRNVSYDIRLVIRDTWVHIKRAQLPQVASSLSYTVILSLIPLLAVSFAIFQMFGGLERLYNMIEPVILDNLAEGVNDEVIAMVQKFITNAHGTTIGVGGLIGLTFTSMSMLWSTEKAINKIWNVPVTRHWLKRICSYCLFVTLGPLALAVSLGLITSSGLPIADFFPNGTGFFVIMTSFFFCVYKWVPHTRVFSKYALFSAFLTAISFHLARTAYATFTTKAVSYGRIYGSLSAVPILLVWIYIVWLVILSGAALTAALQKSDFKRATFESS